MPEATTPPPVNPTPAPTDRPAEPAGSSAQPADPQSGSSAPPNASEPTAEQLLAQIADMQDSLSRLQANNAELLKEKKAAKERRRASETDYEKLAAEYGEENSTLTAELESLKAQLERYRETDRKAFKEEVLKIQDEKLRALYSDPDRFTLEEVRLLNERLSASASVPTPSDVNKPPAPAAGDGGTVAALEVAAATGDYDAVNKAFEALLPKKE